MQDGSGHAPYQRPIDADRVHGDARREPHRKIDDEHDCEIVLIHLVHVVENPQRDLSPFERRSHDLHQLVPKQVACSEKKEGQEQDGNDLPCRDDRASRAYNDQRADVEGRCGRRCELGRTTS